MHRGSSYFRLQISHPSSLDCFLDKEMFTGLIEDVGTIVQLERRTDRAVIEIHYSPVLHDLKQGDSVAVDGVCLTIVHLNPGVFEVEVSQETLRRTTLGKRRAKERVNLERALKLGDRLGGHLVTGHVDEVARVRRVSSQGECRKMTFALSQRGARYLVEKGSVAVDGISLTVNEAGDDWFEVMVIPHTCRHTTLSTKKLGDEVNVEFDIIAKYLEKLAQQADRKMDVRFLSEHGFL